jgi:hypothetical protein
MKLLQVNIFDSNEQPTWLSPRNFAKGRVHHPKENSQVSRRLCCPRCNDRQACRSYWGLLLPNAGWEASLGFRIEMMSPHTVKEDVAIFVDAVWRARFQNAKPH